MNEERLAELERRVARLEAALTGAGQDRRPPEASPSSLDLLRRFEAAAEEETGESAGTIAYVGAALLDGDRHLWASEHRVADLMAADWGPAAALLEAMGSPARLALLAALVRGPRTRAYLQEALGGETTSGHLYHHLRELQRTGLIAQRRRGEYQVVSRAVVPILAALAAALDLGVAPTAQEE
ncbi:DNA-binding transcriptional ArsR family regulator [Thermocatellispora tengchongensis]|uniref:DNA-binding transcriptional ArsR family regulator n=1 Tax=Thermocatellispora tengchongensis TaxID=1073253 RepID=A0A840NW10_9ACTN|nr:helix-turn-helix domain-containing protein [Thermocatellispora tengchongensis]MBB5130366.1 DNA-binding transcriptional ArsR family regulator [Thermocatellispora tengchongensis]